MTSTDGMTGRDGLAVNGGPAAEGGPAVESGPAAELAHLHYLERFLDQARSEGAVSGEAYRGLLARVAAREHSLAGLAPLVPSAPRAALPPVTQPVVFPPVALPPRVVAPAVTPPAQARPWPVTPPAAPSPVRRFWRATRETVRSDLAVHGLAYLGVLLLFAGLFGLTAFSFSSVRVGLRPVAEGLAPAAMLVSAWLLHRRGIVVPARSLEFLGGLLVLVAVLAAFVDGAAFPPDLTGVPLAAALSAAPVLVAAGYAAWGWRHPASPLPHLVGPALWLAAGMAALGWYRPVPAGREIAVPRPGEVAAMLVALAVTLAVSRGLGRRLKVAVLFPAGLVGLGILALLEGLAAGVAGWPPIPVAVSGAAAILALELCDRRLAGSVRVILESLVVVLTAWALVPALGLGWAGVVVAVACVGVTERGLRGTAARGAEVVPVVAMVAGLASAVAAPGALLTASAAVSAWSHARRLRPGRWPYPVAILTIAAAVVPAGVLFGLLGVLAGDVPVGVGGLLVLAGSCCVRVFARPADRFWSWWMPAAAVAVAVLTIGAAPTGWSAAGAAAVAAAVAVSPLRPVPRTWLTGVAMLWAAWLLFGVTALGFGARMVLIAGAALLAVGVAAWWRAMPAGHVGMIGHLAGLACVPLAAVDAGSLAAVIPVTVLGLAATGAALTTVAQETGGTVIPDLLVRCAGALVRGLGDRTKAAVQTVLRQLPAEVAAASLMLFSFDLFQVGGWFAAGPWAVARLTALALGYLLLGRTLHAQALRRSWHRVALALADTGAWTAVLAAVLTEYRDPALVATGVVLAVPLIAGPSLRRRLSVWAAWLASVPFAVLAADRLGLPGSYWSTVIFGWGSALVLGSLAADRLGTGAGDPGTTPSRLTRLSRAPVVVGTAASMIGLLGSAGGSVHRAGWTLLAAAAVTVTAGVLLRLGVLGGAGAALAAAGLGAVLPWSLRDYPWLLVDMAAVALVAAEVTVPRRHRAVRPWERWDLSLFVAAHLLALAGLAVSVAGGTEVAATAVGCGGLAVAVAAGLRRWPWAVAGAVLILAGAAVASAGWASLAFAGIAVAAAVLAARQQGRTRLTLQVASALCGLGAWTAALVWQEASPTFAVQVSSLAGGVLVLLAAAGIRLGKQAADWARVWGSAATAVVVVAGAGLAAPAVSASAGPFVSGAMAAVAVGCGMAAAPLRAPVLRWLAVIALTGSATALADGVSAGVVGVSWGATVAGLAVNGLLLTPWRRRFAAVWAGPLLLLAAAASVTAVAAGVLAEPDHAPLVAALVLAAVLVVTMAVTLKRPGLEALVPVPLCAAWLVYASAALAWQPQWFTVPIGVAALACASLLRVARRSASGPGAGRAPGAGAGLGTSRAPGEPGAAGRPVTTPDVAALEITGMVLMMGASLVQAVSRGPGYGLLGSGIALVLIGWGTLTRVRRRLIGGVAALVAALLLLVVVPLVRVVPHWGGVGAWLALAGAGLIAITAAALLDVTRAAVRRGVTRIADLTRHWE